MSKYLFGPVPSRRLGISLGIDITPAKQCTFNCVYCECGKTDFLTSTRAVYAPVDDVIRELRAYLSTTPVLDSITFSGSGEPTLHTGLGDIISMLVDEFPDYRVTVLTNSSLLWMPEVREALSRATLVVPSLDAVSEETFLRMNRPAKTITSAKVIAGLTTFCEEYHGEKWLEIFIVPGINDTPDEINLFRQVIGTLRISRVQLNTLDRPGAVSWIAPATVERLEEIAGMLGSGVEIIASRRITSEGKSGNADIADLIFATVLVRPSTVEDLAATLPATEQQIQSCLQFMVEDGRLDTRSEARGLFYIARVGRHTLR